MNYSDMIKTEDTDSMYENWKDYRQELTGYIGKSLENYCPKKSWVAIWGAGGCNDIEISELAKDYRLLLIDRDLEKLKEVRKRLGLTSKECKVADVGFWNVSDDDYEMFQALLMDGADLKEIQYYFEDLLDNMLPSIDLQNYSVECSVVVGLASQLNARFAALLHLYKENISPLNMDKLFELISRMNQLATERLFVSIRQITKNLVITGYETVVCYSEEDASKKREQIFESFEKGQDGGDFLSGKEEAFINVAGNEYWHKNIYKAILMDKLEDVGMCQVINWPFNEHKYYPMLVISLIIR